MLRSTYQKVETPQNPQKSSHDSDLPPGWTAHVAPTGHTYYFNTESKKSTYTRPVAEPLPLPIPSYSAGEFAGGFSNNSFVPPVNNTPQIRDAGHNQNQKRHEPKDKPKHTFKIPGQKPWVLVQTKLGRRFVHNTETGESLWKIPGDVLKGVFEFERRQREKKARRERGEPSEDSEEERQKKELEEMDQDDGSSEYEEVTDDEGEEDGPSKRQRTAEPVDDGPVEFNEDDLAFELEDMDGFGDDYEDEDALDEEDCKMLFFDLLDDHKINPYSTWDNVIAEGKIIDDSRYTALPNMKSRHAAWDEWTALRMQDIKEARERQAKTDPKIPYVAFLEEHATTKLYWPEFKRKFKKEEVMKTSRLADKDREKWYREFVKRLQLPSSVLKSDFTALLKSLPLSVLNRDVSMASLPPALVTDLKYISLPPSTRSPLIEAYISSLPPAADSTNAESEAPPNSKQQDRQRREKALADRERKVEAEKQRQMKELRYSKGRLREEQQELERAMNVGRSGLTSQLRGLVNPAEDSE